jgi:hypothetical protein
VHLIAERAFGRGAVGAFSIAGGSIVGRYSVAMHDEHALRPIAAPARKVDPGRGTACTALA